MLKRRVAKFKISPNQGVLGLARIGNRWGFRIAMPRKSATRNRLLALAILVAVALPISQYLIRSSSAADLPVNIGPYAQSVSAGGDHTCAIFNDDGLLYCWGDNTYGQLGIGSNIDQTTPVSVMPYLPSGAKVKQVSAGLQHTCAVVEVASSSQVYCWGKNDNGQLGNGITLPVTTANSQNKNVPVLVSSQSANAQKVSAGFAHTCAIYSSGGVFCWGNNDEGQLGDGSGTFSGGQWTVKPTSSSLPVTVSIVNPAADIATGATHTCTVPRPGFGGYLSCWGGNGSSQFGNNSTDSSSSPGQMLNNQFYTVTAGFFYGCGILRNGEAACWGDNTSGQIGNNTTTVAATPVQVGLQRLPLDLSSGYAHTCAVISGGRLYCWGDDTSGQLLDNDTTYTNKLVPTAVTLNNINGVNQTLSAVTSAGGIAAAKSVSAGFSHTCAIWGDRDGGHSYDTLLCGGLNDDGELGVGTTNASPALIAVDISMVPNNLLPTPTITNVTPNRGPVAGGTDVNITGTNFGQGIQWKQVSAGFDHTCAIASNDQAYCWGSNYNGELGNISGINGSAPISVYTGGVLSGLTIKQISAGLVHTCAIASNDQAYCWGSNYNGELGNNSTNDSLVPVAVDISGVLSGLTIKQISAGNGHTCAIASNDQAYCWGGLLGDNSTTSSSTPVAVDTSGVLSGFTIKQISAGESHTCAIASNDQAYCWGYNGSSQLGDNSTNDSSTPVAVDTSGVLSGLTIKQISAGFDHTCAIASNDQAYCWGSNYNGELGNNSTNDSSTPVAVDTSGASAGLTIKQIFTGDYHTCAIASNDQAYCWGYNDSSQLGDNSTTSSSTPVAVDTSGVLSGFTIKQISAGESHTCAIASNDQAYCWGKNRDGQLGTAQLPLSSSVPIAVTPLPATPSIASITFGDTPVNSFAVTSPTSITAVTPPHAAGPVDVVITTTDGQTVTYPNGFTYYEVPAAPVLNSLSPGTDQTTLSWTAPAYNGYSPITGYKIEISNDNGITWTNLVANTGNTDTNYTYTIPDDTISYSFRVSAINEAGAGPASNVLSTQPSFIDLSVDTNLVGINVTPSTASGVVSNAKHTVSFTTNKSHGVSLSLSTNTSHNNLVNTVDNSRTIAAGGGSMTSPTTLAVNTWGFAIANSNTNISNGFDGSYGTESNNSSSTSKWAMVPTLSSPLTIKSTSVANPLISNNTDVWYGVRIDASTPAGTYNTTVLYTAVGNIAP